MSLRKKHSWNEENTCNVCSAKRIQKYNEKLGYFETFYMSSKGGSYTTRAPQCNDNQLELFTFDINGQSQING